MFKFKAVFAFAFAAFLACFTFAYASAADILDLSDYEGENIVFTEFSSADIYVDGVCVAKDTNTVSKDLVGLGKHIITAEDGTGIVFQKDYSVVNSYFGNGASYDFSDYSGGSYTVDSKRVFVEGSSGALGNVSVDGSHGVSLGLLRRDSATAASWMRNDFVSALSYGGLESMHYEMELYSSEHIKDYPITLVNNSKNYINFINFMGSGSTAAKNNIRIYSNGKTYADVPYDVSGVWYKVAFDITMLENGGAVYNLYICKYDESSESYEEVYGAKNLSVPNTLVSLTGLRFTGAYGDDAPGTYLAIDNVYYGYKNITPLVETINGSDASVIDFKSSYIELGLSGPIIPDSVSKDTVSVNGPLGDVGILEVVMPDDRTMRIILAEKLISNSRYTVTLDRSISVTQSNVLGYNLVQNISSSKDSVEVSNLKVSGDKIMADIENTTDSDAVVHIIVTYFGGTEYIRTKAFDYTAAGNSSGVFEGLNTVPGGCTEIQISFADKYIQPRIISSTTWREWN